MTDWSSGLWETQPFPSVSGAIDADSLCRVQHPLLPSKFLWFPKSWDSVQTDFNQKRLRLSCVSFVLVNPVWIWPIRCSQIQLHDAHSRWWVFSNYLDAAGEIPTLSRFLPSQNMGHVACEFLKHNLTASCLLPDFLSALFLSWE